MPVEWWVVFATLVGPVLAVQTQKTIERATARRDRRNRIFVALMANRATRLADDFVKALNLIDIEFLPGWFGRAKDLAVLSAWHELLGVFSNGPPAGADAGLHFSWNLQVEDRLVDLLAAIAAATGYSLTREQLRRGVYHPQGTAEREQAWLATLDGLRKVFTGQAPIPMAVKEFPVSPELTQAQAELANRAASAYDEESGALKVKQVG
ncbi:DUF6680 family protein [Bradyrhizobium elkanii]|uniref:DUF6680 domain-containing protein n=1 Tax=Bradyrhizobium elkanii TaxID=29448 RepID=A0A8I1YDI1_BRAEL|nr:DUF6680 family protein [Bradyrhizobium elkanii]MBP1297417.1 hypothetical protein [Bradyrhizobium elkanii]